MVPPARSPADSDPPAPVVPANTSVEDPLPTAVPAKQSIAEELKEMRFASYLLRTKSKSRSVFSSKVLPSAHFYNTSPGKLDTGVIVIDFDMGEDEEPSNKREDKDNQREDREPLADRTVRRCPDMRWRLLTLCPQGTPTFVARAVVSCRQKEGIYILMPMPQFDQVNEAYEAYKDAVPDRLETFLPNKEKYYRNASDKPYDPFKHKLQYDAESVFWLLLWWAIQACPLGASLDDNKIDERDWAALRSKQDEKRDPRERFVKESLTDVFHPAYEPLEALLEDMAEQLCGDHHEQGDDQSRKLPDYLHEAFQRLIIKFLFAHYDEDFMTTQKREEFRKISDVAPMVPPKSSHQIARARASASSHSRNVEPPSSYSLRSAPRSTPSNASRKRKSGNKDATSSDTNDEDANDNEYHPKKKSVSTVSCFSILFFTSRLYAACQIMHSQYGIDDHGEAVQKSF